MAAAPTPAQRTGLRVRTVLRVVAPGVFVLLALLAVLGALDVVAGVPPQLFAVTVLVAPTALAVYWRPAYRVPEGLLLTGLSALTLGVAGAGWGSVVAPAVGAATLVGLLLVPRGPAAPAAASAVRAPSRMPKINTPGGRRRPGPGR